MCSVQNVFRKESGVVSKWDMSESCCIGGGMCLCGGMCLRWSGLQCVSSVVTYEYVVLHVNESCHM